MSNKTLAGRLGNPEETFLTDPRADPRIAALLEAVGSLTEALDPVASGAPLEDCLNYCRAFEDAAAATHPMQEQMMPTFDTVENTIEVIKGVDGNDITLYIHTPKNSTEAGPCIVHTHGGGMVLMTAADPGFVRWRNDLAASGMRVIGVEFRNGGGRLGNHPFPAGLNDCASAVNWVHDNRARLGISNIVISGESGGGNLSIATTLKAKKEGWLDQISGVYAMCPYISGAYENPPSELVSLIENDGYQLDTSTMSVMVKIYDPENRHAKNPLAWPYQASPEELAGLPPHMISVNELDPLRDEGLAFYRKLMSAGVNAIARTVHGTPHAGDITFPDVTPDIYKQSLNSLCQFVRSCDG